MSFCPFLREKCPKDDCMMWRDEECLVASFLQGVSQQAETSAAVSSEDSIIGVHSAGAVPEWLKEISAEELAEELIEFKNKEYPELNHYLLGRISSFYLANKGVSDLYSFPEMSMKMSKAQFIAEEKLRKEEERVKKEQLGKEKEELPSLVSQCVDWAKNNGLARLTVADVDTYLIEKDLEILQETKRALYAMANVRMKSKSQS